MTYLRIQESKFWGWVIGALSLGLALGLTAMLLLGQYTMANRTAALESELESQTQESSATIADLQARLTSAEESAGALAATNAKLSSDLAAAKASGKKASSTATTTVTFVSRSVTPDSVATSGTITLSVRVKGHPDKVTMRIATASGSFDQTYTLKKATSGSTETWRRVVDAPNKKGEYRYFATATLGSTKTTMPGVSAYTFQVK